MHLEHFIRQQRQDKDILLMSHTVLGYPSWDDNRAAIAALVRGGVELIELQFPFSEPIADGPILLAANHAAVQSDVSVRDCLSFAAEMTQTYPQTRFVIMTYINILFRYGIRDFVEAAALGGVAGCIIPDLPCEQAEHYIRVCRENALATIFLVTPNNSLERIQQILRHTSGLIYCVTRKGVTGHHTQLSNAAQQYLSQVQSVSQLPMAVGFGIQSVDDVSKLIGHADIAVIGSQAVKHYTNCGADSLECLIRELRSG
ncbi:MAG: tryptophan synthase subunit alpha [Cyanobacteria bacterium P01_H01_bin.21]